MNGHLISRERFDYLPSTTNTPTTAKIAHFPNVDLIEKDQQVSVTLLDKHMKLQFWDLTSTLVHLYSATHINYTDIFQSNLRIQSTHAMLFPCIYPTNHSL